MNGVRLGLAGVIGMATLAVGEVLVETRWGEFPRPPEYAIADPNGRVTGVLPQGWMDDSAWAPMWIRYGFEDEQGHRFLRMNATRIEGDGRAQLACYPVADAEEERTYRLTLEVRNLTGKPVTFGLRMRERPWEFYWQRSEPFSANWETHTYEFRMARNDKAMGVWINLGGTGILDVGRVRLEGLSDAELVAEIRARYPDGGPANLFRNTRFPLGLQNGWSLDRDNSDGDVAVAEAADVPGPSGAAALRLKSAERLILRSEPFPIVCPVVEHVASFSIKGSGNWNAAVFKEHQTLGSKAVTPTADWQRVVIPFAVKPGIGFAQLALDGTGEILVDAFRAGPAAKGDAYISPGEFEVALAPAGRTDAVPARVLFTDEPARLVRTVTGIGQPAVLKSALVNVYGEQIPLPDVPVGGEAFAVSDSVDVAPFLAERPVGSFRLEARVERDGEACSPPNELVFHRLPRPVFWGEDAPDSPFGIHTNSTRRHNLMAKAVGINWVRLHDAGLPYFGWWNLEPEKGQWRFFDRDLRRYRDAGLKIFAELGTAPPWASYYADTGLKTFGYFDKFFQPKDLTEYETYVRTVCTRYRDMIDAFDVWNEPWIHAWWGVAYDHAEGGRAGYITSAEPQKDFARLTELARRTARSVNPDAVVMGFNTTTSGPGENHFSGSQWTQGILDAGGLESCDGIAYHCYTGGGVGYPGDTVETGLAEALGPIRKREGTVPKPVWMTEGSPLIYRMKNGIYRHTLPFESADDVWDSADRLVRYLTSMLANGVSRVFLYSMHSHGMFTTEVKQWNALTTDDGYLHPAGVAHAVFARQLEGKAFVERRALGTGIHAYLFADENSAIAVISSSPEFEPAPLPKGLSVTDLFGNPVPEGTRFEGKVLYLTARTPDELRKGLP